MKYVLYEKQYEEIEIDAATDGEWIPVGGYGGDSISATVIASDGDTPTDAGAQFEAANREDKSDAVLVGTAVEVTTDTTYALTIDRPPFKYYRLTYAIGSGSFVSNATVVVKGDKAG